MGKKEESEKEVESCIKEVENWKEKVKNGKRRLTLRKRKVASEREAADMGLGLAREKLRIAEESANFHTQRYYKIMLVDVVASAVAASSPHSVDPWSNSALSIASNRPEYLRKQVVDHYAFCLTGVKGDRKKVVTAHLLPQSPRIVS